MENEERIQKWVKKIQKKIEKMEPAYNKLINGNTAEDHKMAELMHQDLYLSVPDDIADEVFDRL